MSIIEVPIVLSLNNYSVMESNPLIFNDFNNN